MEQNSESNAEITEVPGGLEMANATLRTFGAIWRANWEANWPAVKLLPGVRNWFWMFQKVPIVIASAGPSLADSIATLGEYAGRYMLITVDAAMGRLMAAGLVPDIVVTGDAQAHTADFFRGHKKLPLVAACPWQSPELIEMLLERGALVPYTEASEPETAGHEFFWKTVIKNYFGGNAGYFGDLMPGHTVSSAALSLAFVIGARPIILIGHDLSWKDDAGGGSNIDVLPTRSMAGEELKTCRGYFLTKMWYENVAIPQMQEHGTVIINSTPGGILDRCFREHIEVILRRCAFHKPLNFSLALRQYLNFRRIA